MKTINFFRSKLFALTLALVASVSSFAYDEMPDFQVDGLYYNFLEEDNVEVTHPYIPVVPVENVASNTKKKSHAISADDYYNLTNLVIPSTVTYEGKVYNVTRIGFDAFNQCDKLTFVDIPSSVKTIGGGAFYFCSSLTSITLKEGLEHIEWYAFEGCRSLENITFPNSLKTIGNYAFSNTLWYKNHPNGAVYAGNVFYKYKGDIPQNTSFVIKEGTVSISPYAFVKENYHEDYSLVSVSIPNSVEVIGEGAFYRCRALTSIVIPDGVTTIETLAFHYCKALKSVTCEAVNPPALSGSVFLSTPIADATLYVPAESIEAYKTATEWKDFGQILPITWSAECYEFRDFNLGIGLFPRKSSLVYTLYHTDDRTIEPPYVDSVWILDPELDKQNPLHVHTLYAQPGDTIDLSFLEKNKHYILRVHINECQMSRVFLHRVVKWEYEWCNQWNVLWFDGMQFDETASTSHYQLGQDTVIGDYTYRKFTSQTSVRFTEDWKVYVYYEGFDDNDPYTEDLPAGEYLAYDFSAQVGDTLEVFSGIGTYSTYLCVVDDVQITDIQTALRTITLHKICRMDTDGDGVEEEYGCGEMTWIEGVGSPEGFLISDLPCGWVGGGTNHLLCAYKGDELKYTGPLYEEYGCEYNAGPFNEKLLGTWRVVGGNEIISISDSIIVFIGLTQKYTASATQLTVERLWIPEEESYRWANCNYTLSNDTLWIDNFMPLLVATYPPTFGPITLVKVKHEDLFPTLWGLQRTGCTKTIGENENGTVWGSRSYLMQGIGNTIIDGKQYVLFGTNNIYDEYCSLWLREENNKILVYSTAQKKDLVLYDFTLNVGDSLPRLYVDEELSSIVDYFKYEADWEYTKPLFVTEVSTITLLDGKEYKKWTFDNGMQYVEGIGSFGISYGHNDFYQLIVNAPLYSDVYSQHLVCTSRNGQLLYQMDASEMEQLETECLCEAENPEDLFPTLWGLQRTVCNEYCGETEDDNSANNTYQQTFERIFFENDKPYILCSGYLLREEDNMILIYSQTLNKDLVLYDFTLEVGDSLLALYINAPQWDPPQSEDIIIVTPPYNGYVVDHDYNGKPDPVVVTDISTVTLLDGKEHKKWTFNNGMEYVEGIGSFGNGQWSGDLFQLIANKDVPTCLLDEHLVCVSKNNKLLYMMDDAEMERLGAECLCEAENPEDLFPTLWGLQRTEVEFHIDGAGAPSLVSFNEYTPTFVNGKWYLYDGMNYLREENNQVLLYSPHFEIYKDIVLYDWTLEVGDTLPYYFDKSAYKGAYYVVTNVSTITLLDGKEYKKWTLACGIEYIEGIGAINGEGFGNYFCIQHTAHPATYIDTHLVCASKNNKLLYLIDDAEMERLGAECLCEAENPEDLFPTLWGLQRTVCNEYCGETEDDNSDNITYKQTFTSISFENNKPYILCRGYLLREESNKILLYSESLNKEIVLYDFTLEVGDSLPAYIEHFDETIYPADTLVVTDVSYVTLLDGKEYKKWTFNNGMEYVEGIGMYGGHRNGNFVGLIQELVVPCHTGTHLVCVSKNGKLLYQMDDAEMERLGAECLCDYDRGPLKDNAKNGKIGGRPTPTQWNQLELDLREMENGNTILRAETFSYTLENDSIVANGKTFYQLARQSTKDTATTKSFVGALHFGEDEDNRVYFLRDGVEYVLYDFTAEPGDTIEIFAGINNYPQDSTYTHVVTGKDTLENGACRMLLEVVFPDETATAENAEKVWLAGLGSVDGIVHNAATRATTARSSDTQTSVMLCAWRDDNCLYTTDHPDYNTLGCVYNIDEMTSVEDIHSSLPMTDCYKLLRNGQLLIIHKGKTYNVLGVPVE